MALFGIKTFLSGGIFGGALTLAGVYSPSIIIDQMHFENFHMLKTFVAASASSAVLIYLTRHIFVINTKATPRAPSTIGLFGPYDGNILGGLLLGFGMAMTGACPGTVLPQFATSVPSAPLVAIGGVLGGILWSGVGKELIKGKNEICGSPGNIDEKPQATLATRTVYERLGVSEAVGLKGYELLCITILGTATLAFPTTGPTVIPPILGGVLVGFSQLTSLLLTSNTLGISAAYEQIGDVIFWALRPSSSEKGKGNLPNITSTYFALGTLAGSWGITRAVSLPALEGVNVSNWSAVVGGVVMLFGSRLAGGCTSGHGISGMSMLSISSFISVAAMFAGGMGLAAILG